MSNKVKIETDDRQLQLTARSSSCPNPLSVQMGQWQNCLSVLPVMDRHVLCDKVFLDKELIVINIPGIPQISQAIIAKLFVCLSQDHHKLC